MEQIRSVLNSTVQFLNKFKNGKFHHVCSFLFLLSLPLVFKSYPPTSAELSKEVRFSIFKKKSGDESLSIYGKLQFPNDPLTDYPGYIVSHDDPSANCNEGKPRPNLKSTVLLENLHNKCQLSKRSRLAARAGYDVIVFYNHSHINSKQSYVDADITTIKISNEDALRLLDYTFPKSVRYNVLIQHYESKSILQPFNEDPFHFMVVFRASFWLLYIQGVIYWLITFTIWRLCLVPDEYSIWGIIRCFIYPPGMYDFLLVDAEINLSPFRRLMNCILKRKEGKYLHVDTTKIVHKPWRTKLSKDDFEYVSTLGCGTYGKITEEIFLQGKKNVAIKTVLAQGYVVSLLEAEILALGNCCDGIVEMLYGFISPLHIHFVMNIMAGNLSNIMTNLLPCHARIYTVELGLTIETLHSLGIGHRDLKPANVMLDKNYHIKLGDFGCARKFADEKEVVEEDSGTKLYWAPENYNKKWTLGSDWWAFGCIVFEMFYSYHQHFLNSHETVCLYQTGNINDYNIKRRIEVIRDLQARELLSKCLTTDMIRMPFEDFKLSERDSYMGVPIPINQSEDILDHFPMGTTMYGPGSTPEPYLDQLINDYDRREEDHHYLFQNTENEFADFYFDNADVNCYRNNSVIGKYFVKNSERENLESNNNIKH